MYWGLINFRTESLLYMVALTRDDAVRKAISNFYTRHRYVGPGIRGRDLKAVGIPPGPVYSEILNRIIDQKLDGRLESRQEEIEFARGYALENKLIP